MQICRNCDNLWWPICTTLRIRNAAVTEAEAEAAAQSFPQTRTRMSMCEECVLEYVSECVWAKRSTWRDVEFIDDDFTAIPLPSFWRQQKQKPEKKK